MLLTHSASILSCNSIILLYSDVFLFCILRNPNLQGIDFFLDLEICWESREMIWEFVIDFFVFGFGNLLGEQRDEMRTDDLSRVI